MSPKSVVVFVRLKVIKQPSSHYNSSGLQKTYLDIKTEVKTLLTLISKQPNKMIYYRQELIENLRRLKNAILGFLYLI